MPNQKDKVIIDTNLWISFLLRTDYSRLDQLFTDQLLTLLFSQALLDEFIEVSQRPKFRKYFTLTDLQNLLIQIRKRAEFIVVTQKIIFYFHLQKMEKRHTLLQVTETYFT